MNILKRIDLDKPKKTTESFIYQCLPVLAHVRGSSPSDIISKLQENKEYDIYGERYHGQEILRLWKFFHEANPSTYLPTRATKCTAISSGVPIVMLAYKHQHDIPYEKWRGDKFTRLMMPKSLGYLTGYSEHANGENLDLAGLATKWPVATLRCYLEDFLTDANTGKMHEMTSYKAYKVGDKDFDALPSSLKRMLLQSWIYYPAIRHSNMITNPNDWDNLADPLYDVDITTDKNANVDDVWDSILTKAESKKDNLPW